MKPTFFTQDLNEHAEEMRQYLPVNASMDFESLAPAMGDAERKYILPVIGQTNFDSLAEYYATEHQTRTYKDELIERIQAAVIRLAFFDSFDLMSVTLSDRGLQDMNGENRAYRYQSDAAKDTLGRQAYEYLQYFYDAYIESELYTSGAPARQSQLFPSYREFFDILYIEPDFRLFNKLLPQINAAEQIDLPAQIGSVLAEELLTSSTGRMRNSSVLINARHYIANKVISDSVMTLHAYISDDGTTTRNIKAESGSSAGTNKQVADKNTRLLLQKIFAERAESGAYRMRAFLTANSATYPEFASVSKDDHRNNIPSQGKHTFRV